MFPINDDNPTNTTAYVTYTLILLNVLIFIYELSLTPPQLERFFQLYAVIPRELTANFSGITVNQPIPEPLTLITSQFLHGGFAHIFGNMLFLWIFGNNIEDQLGHLKYSNFLPSLWCFSRLISVVFFHRICITFFGRKWCYCGCIRCLYFALSSRQSPNFNLPRNIYSLSQNSRHLLFGNMVFSTSFIRRC